MILSEDLVVRLYLSTGFLHPAARIVTSRLGSAACQIRSSVIEQSGSPFT